MERSQETTMTKAYDVKVLIARYKEKGLDIAEEAAKILLEETFDWVEESAKLSSNVYDDAGLLIVPTAKKFVLEAIDKIDNQVG